MGNTCVIFSDTNNDGEPEIIQEADYYPFGMRHDRSTTATNHYLYNGKELNADLGLDWYDYGARWLDVETGRWSTIDPLAENYASMSPFNYVANNPISNIDPDGRRIIMSNAIEANNLVADLNRVYEDKYGFKSAFKANTKTFNVKKKNENYSYWWSWYSDEPEFITVKEPRTIIETNNQFDWNTDVYTKAMFDIINTKADITVDIIADKGVLARQTAGRAGFRNGLLDDLGGGHAVHSGYVVLSDLLSNTQVGGNNTHKWTLGHVALHELLYHVHPLGNYEEDTVDGANTMRIYYGGRSGGSHNSGNKKNKMLLDVNEKQRLEKLRNSTGKKSKP